jgi:hypothetical protein
MYTCSQLGQQPLPNNRIYTFPPNGPLFNEINEKVLSGTNLFCVALSKVEERSELGVLGYPERLASLLVDLHRCLVGCAIANQVRAIAR